MAYYRNGLKHSTAIWESASMQHLVRVRCLQRRCDNMATYDPHELWALFWKRGWDDAFRIAQLRFYCRACSSIAGFRVKCAEMSDLGTSSGAITHRLPRMATERDWKQFIARHKS